MSATPAKLRDGSWGARVQGRASVGDRITITTRSGKSWDATVSRVLWTGDGASIVATATRTGGREHRGSRGSRTWTGCSCGSIEEYSRPSDCASCRFDAEDC